MNDISIATTCVNFGDYLEIVAPTWKFTKRVVVTTIPSDELTKRVCRENGFEIVETQCMFDEGSKFNRGLAINEALKKLKAEEVILVLDSDIAIPQNVVNRMRTQHLGDFLYGIRRTFVWNQNHILSVDPFVVDESKASIDSLESPHYINVFPIGYFQLFQNRSQFYLNEYREKIGGEDIRFIKKHWPDKDMRRVWNDMSVYHLGRHAFHWSGRMDDKFFSKKQIPYL